MVEEGGGGEERSDLADTCVAAGIWLHSPVELTLPSLEGVLGSSEGHSEGLTEGLSSVVSHLGASQTSFSPGFAIFGPPVTAHYPPDNPFGQSPASCSLSPL